MRILMTAALAAATLVPVAASAQSYREVQQDHREVRQDRRELQQARQYGDRGDIRDARRELREDRQELREDRRDFRRAHNGSAYYGPRGYAYRTPTIGYQFAPSYYGRNYWVTDYNRYRLARPGYGRQWIRYGNDLVLINLRNGRVLQVRHRFFY